VRDAAEKSGMHKVLPAGIVVQSSEPETIELDEDLLARAKRALGAPTTRATVEEALRRVADAGDAAERDRRERQLELLEELPRHLDLDALRSDEMWR